MDPAKIHVIGIKNGFEPTNHGEMRFDDFAVLRGNYYGFLTLEEAMEMFNLTKQVNEWLGKHSKFISSI